MADRPRSAQARLAARRHLRHPAVIHASHLRTERDQGGLSPVGRANDWLATHLAVVFGLVWTIWIFFVVPLLAQLLPQAAQNKVFFYASGWIQLFALPLLAYVSNKVQRTSDAQSEVMHVALTHIATVSDQNRELLDQNTELTRQVHALVRKLSARNEGG